MECCLASQHLANVFSGLIKLNNKLAVMLHASHAKTHVTGMCAIVSLVTLSLLKANEVHASSVSSSLR